MKTLQSAADWYRRKGFSVIPVKKDKRPFVKWEQCQTDPADENQVRQWWKKWPAANIGIVTGAVSGVMCVDVDSDAGREAFEDLLPDDLICPISKTPSGGQHYYFKYRKGLSNGVRVILDTDFRTDGGYVIAPPSVGEKGNYQWIEDLKISSVTPPKMPETIYSIFEQGGHAGVASSSEHGFIYNSTNDFTRGGPTKEPVHDSPHLSTNVHKLFSKGSRDQTLFHIANHLVKGGMPQDNIMQILSFFVL